jgi:3-oxoacyl-[acyl-carrier protein] reductase
MMLSDCKMIITGGASGLGRAMAESFSVKALKVIVIDRNEAALEELATQYPAIQTVAVDLTNQEAVHQIAAALFQEHGKINVLVNNAGIIHSEPLVNILKPEDPRHSIDNWHKTIDINLNAVFYATVNVAERMVKTRSKGVIINISSISSYGNAGQSAYAATKAALNALTVTWAKELGMFGIRCVAIAPGFIDTPSTRAALSEAKIKDYQKSTPIGRMGKTDEIMQAVQFIVENDFYNATILNLDGGLKI